MLRCKLLSARPAGKADHQRTTLASEGCRPTEKTSPIEVSVQLLTGGTAASFWQLLRCSRSPSSLLPRRFRGSAAVFGRLCRVRCLTREHRFQPLVNLRFFPEQAPEQQSGAQQTDRHHLHPRPLVVAPHRLADAPHPRTGLAGREGSGPLALRIRALGAPPPCQPPSGGRQAREAPRPAKTQASETRRRRLRHPLRHPRPRGRRLTASGPAPSSSRRARPASSPRRPEAEVEARAEAAAGGREPGRAGRGAKRTAGAGRAAGGGVRGLPALPQYR